MRIYAAGEAIGPAWEHTKALLWQDRRAKRLLKLCLVAIGAELLSLNFNASGLNRLGRLPPGLQALLAFLAILGGFFTLALSVGLLYLSSRLQFVLFDVILLRDDRVTPAWRRHGHHTWRWLSVRLFIVTGTLLALSPLAVPLVLTTLGIVRGLQKPTAVPGNPALLLHLLRPLFLVALEGVLVYLLFAGIVAFVCDLALPALALEDLRFGDILRRAWQIFRADTQPLLLYAALRLLVTVGVRLLTSLVFLCIGLIVILPLVLVVGMLLRPGQSGNPGWTAALFLLVAVLGLAFVVLALLLALLVYGTFYTFLRAWSLYVLGGRYPLLGQYLDPSPVAVPVWTPPASIPPEDDDDGNGPDLPTTPALA